MQSKRSMIVFTACRLGTQYVENVLLEKLTKTLKASVPNGLGYEECFRTPNCTRRALDCSSEPVAKSRRTESPSMGLRDHFSESASGVTNAARSIEKMNMQRMKILREAGEDKREIVMDLVTRKSHSPSWSAHKNV